MLAIAAISSPVSFAAPAAAQTADPHLPDGQWRLTKLEDGCSVARDFVKDGERITLAIKRIHPGADVQFAVIGADIIEGASSLEAGFLPSENLHRFDRVAPAAIGNREGVVFAGRLLPHNEGGMRIDESEVTDFVVVDPRGTRTRLHTRAIDKATAALDDCVSKKLLDLGVDLEAQSELSRHVSPNKLGEWAGKIQRGYPMEAVRNRWDGNVPLRLIVDAKGRVTHCHVTNFLTAEVLRKAACDGMMKHAQFNPALDAEGRPATAFTFQAIRYVISSGQRGFSADAHGFAIPDN